MKKRSGKPHRRLDKTNPDTPEDAAVKRQLLETIRDMMPDFVKLFRKADPGRPAAAVHTGHLLLTALECFRAARADEEKMVPIVEHYELSGFTSLVQCLQFFFPGHEVKAGPGLAHPNAPDPNCLAVSVDGPDIKGVVFQSAPGVDPPWTKGLVKRLNKSPAST